MWFYRSHLSSKKAQQLHKQVFVWYGPEKNININIQDNSEVYNLSRPERNGFLPWAYLKCPSSFRYHATRSLQRLRGPQASVLHLPHHPNHHAKCIRFLMCHQARRGRRIFLNAALRCRHWWQWGGLCYRYRLRLSVETLFLSRVSRNKMQ